MQKTFSFLLFDWFGLQPSTMGYLFCISTEVFNGKLCQSVKYDNDGMPWGKSKENLTFPLGISVLRQDPLDLGFWSFLTFLHYGIEDVERHLL